MENIFRYSGLAKTFLQGICSERNNRRGRQEKRWEDNVKEWSRIGVGRFRILGGGGGQGGAKFQAGT